MKLRLNSADEALPDAKSRLLFASRRLLFAAFWLLMLSPSGNSLAAETREPALSPTTLKILSLEELMQLEITSVSKRPEPYGQAAAAIQVITSEDIRRSGAVILPEALRLADNLEVAQKNAHSWAISARGFNTDLANKLLVLMDGRTVYAPLFSGVFWDQQDYLLEDIERIEVISGPGGTLWGANAVNGVINIITKSARDTQGFHLDGGGGTEWRGFTGARYGTALAPNVNLRVYGKYFDRDEAVFPDGSDASDSWRMGRGGFRLDAEPSPENTFTLQGDYFDGDEDLSTGGHAQASGGNILGRWTRVLSEDSDFKLQLYYDRTHLSLPVPELVLNSLLLAPSGTLTDDLDTFDLDFQHRFPIGERQQIVWGLGYRFTHNVVHNAPALAFQPATLDRDLFSAFFQDEIKLGEQFFFTLGTKVEHNDYTGLEWEPSARLAWMPTERQTVWAAISRAVRMPSRVDRHERLPTPLAAPLVENLLIGGADFNSENVIAYEVGYRAQLSPSVSASVATFYNVYDDLRSTRVSPPPAFLGLPLVFANELEGETYGVELSVNVQLCEWWRLRGGYDFMEQDIRVQDGRVDFNSALNETADPKHQFSLRSSMNLARNVELDAALRWVDSFRFNNSGAPGTVPSYWELDARLNWQVTRNLEVSVVGQNLLHDQHAEYVISSPNPRAEIQRGVYGKVTWRF